MQTIETYLRNQDRGLTAWITDQLRTGKMLEAYRRANRRQEYPSLHMHCDGASFNYSMLYYYSLMSAERGAFLPSPVCEAHSRWNAWTRRELEAHRFYREQPEVTPECSRIDEVD